MQLTTGDVFDRYTIDGELGEGGMGRVYSAYDPRLHRRVALKVLTVTAPESNAGSSNPPSEGAARMVREARAAAALDHPNAVAIFDVGEVDGSPFIAMELIEGLSLRAYIARRDVAWDRRLRWLADVARALAAAHKRGLVHRDIKPENVMVREDGVVKVLDFGIARRPDAPVDPTGETQRVGLDTLTEKGTVIGTPHYMSPEQMRGDALDGRSDQFAWGVLAYELLAGKPPWRRSDNQMASMAEVLTRDPHPLEVEGMPDVVRHAIFRALAKSADERFPTMDAVLRVIEPYVSGSASEVNEPATGPMTPIFPDTETTSASPTPPVAPEPRHTRKRRPRVVAIVAVVAPLAIAFGVLAVHRFAPRLSPIAGVADAAPRPTAITDLPDPPTNNREALVAYRAALQVYRDGSGSVAPRLRRAVQLEPNLASAHMRLALLRYQLSPSEARDSYRVAFEQRATLSERDRGLLRSLEPLVVPLRQKVDLAAHVRATEELVARYPLDAELWYDLGLAYGDGSQRELQLGAFERASEIDPKFARAWWQRGQIAAYLERPKLARESLETCLRVSPAATSCSWNLITIDEIDGACGNVEEEARRWIVADGRDPLGHFALAAALLARDRPTASVSEALLQKERAEPDDERPKSEAMDAILLGFLSGGFDAVESAAKKLDGLVASAQMENEHQAGARAILDVYLETGRVQEAAAYAETYLQRREAWLPDPLLEDFALANDVTPDALRALRAAGRIDPAELARRRDVWLARWPKDLGPFLWMHGHAALVETEEEAKAELARRGALDLPRYTPKTLVSARVGRVLFLAGRVDEALPYLERAATSCLALERPVEHTHANLWLGRAREAKGDAEGACKAYRVVMDRWGKAKPKSVSAAEAGARMRVLACR